MCFKKNFMTSVGFLSHWLSELWIENTMSFFFYSSQTTYIVSLYDGILKKKKKGSMGKILIFSKTLCSFTHAWVHFLVFKINSQDQAALFK